MNEFDLEQTVGDLFAALGGLPTTPISVCIAAGVLALVVGPPDANAWIENGRQAALTHDVRGFARFFDKAVTKSKNGASSS